MKMKFGGKFSSTGVIEHKSSCWVVLLLAADHRHVDNIIGFNNISIIIIIITLITTALLSSLS